MKKDLRIEGVHIDLDALKADNHTAQSLKKTDIFSHLPEAQQEHAYKVLNDELSAHEAAPVAITVERGKSVKTVEAAPPPSKSAKK